MILSLVTVFVLCLLLTPACQQGVTDEDISSINRTGTCVQAKPIGLSNIDRSPGAITWTPLTNPPSPARFYEVIYHPATTTAYRSKLVDLSLFATELTDLLDFTNYVVYVRVSCTTFGYGPLSDPVSFRTPPTVPSAIVSNLRVHPDYTGVRSLVLIQWDHIPVEAWNGDVGGYFIYLYLLPDRIRQNKIYPVIYPRNTYQIGLPDGDYEIQVITFNQQGNISINGTLSGVFTVGAYTRDTELNYPFVYIIVPGLIFLVVIIVITVVMFKMVHDRRKRTVTYCKNTDIALHDIKGYSNAMPQVHSPSMSLSPTVTSPSVMGPAGPQHMSLTTRPLPLSPTNAPSSMPHQTNAPSSMPHQTNTPSSMPHQMNAPSSTSHQHQVLEQEPPAFGNGLASNFQPPKKLPHPGPLPQLSEGAEPGFVPMHRSLTNQSAASVFTPGVVSGQFQQQPVQRQRARTVGGSIPSPYEVPEHNGSTLSRSDAASRPSSAHSSAHHKAGPHRVPTFPPPPAHSPPPLTHSSMELRARMDSGQKVLVSPPGQNTLPRTLHSPHSGGVMNHSGMKPMRSDGHFPIFESEEKNDQEKMVYIRPPLDSSMEASIHSGSSYGPRDVNGTSVNRRPSLDRAHYPYQGAMNGSVTDSEAFSSFSEMTDTRSVPSRLPQAPPHHPSHSVVADRERSMRSQGRESMFSETSIELSISSSERDMSPAWDHRGVTSDVGVGVLREASQSPENRETVSEVGAGLKGRPHHVFKQV